jgi:hypothetical protein
MPDLSKLAENFSPEDIEWRPSHAGRGGKGIFCLVVAYITNRAIQERLDAVCGVDGWRNEEPRMIEVNGKTAFVCGISIKVARETTVLTAEGSLTTKNEEWVTKWDVSEPTAIEPAKGGFSGAMKRAGSQWGIGRYLYHLDAVFADTSEENQTGSRLWNKAKRTKDLPEFWWKTPNLPAWALPKEEEKPVTPKQLEELKKAWRLKFAPDQKNAAELREGFTRFVAGVVGESFPSADVACWTHDALERCTKRINETKEPGGVSSDVPFE